MVEIAELAKTISEIAVDAAAARAMVAVVGVGESEAFQSPELGLDEIQPGSLGGRPDRVAGKFFEQGQKARMSCTLCRWSSTTHGRVRG